MSGFVNIQYAAEQLGVTESCLFRDAPKYRPFLRKASEGSYDAGFDLSSFMKVEERKEQLLERTKLLTEYLCHIEGLTYREMGELTGVGKQSICQCIYGFNGAYKIAKAIRNKRPFHFKRFEEYYGW